DLSCLCSFPMGFELKTGRTSNRSHFVRDRADLSFSLSFWLSSDPAMPRPFKPAEVAEFFARFAAQDPNPRTELRYKNPYTLLVAVVLSAQATDTGVNKATAPLFAIHDTPQKMVELGEDALREAIKTIGL